MIRKHNVNRKGRKSYSEGFKVSVVEELASGKSSQAEIQRRYGISSASTISGWIRKYGKKGLERINEMSKSKSSMSKLATGRNDKEESLMAEIKRLKRELRQAQVKNLVQETMLEIIEEDYGLDRIKKKLNIEQLSDYTPEVLK